MNCTLTLPGEGDILAHSFPPLGAFGMKKAARAWGGAAVGGQLGERG